MHIKQRKETYLAISKTTLCLNPGNDLDLPKVNLQPLVDFRSDLLFRTPSPSFDFLPYSVQLKRETCMNILLINTYILV